MMQDAKNHWGGLSVAMIGHGGFDRHVAAWLALRPRGNAGGGAGVWAIHVRLKTHRLSLLH